MTISTVSLIGMIASIIGVMISIYLLIKVGKLTRAREEEREFMKKILFIEEIDGELAKIIEFLSKLDIKKIETKEHSKKLNELRGMVKGALKAVDEIYGGYGLRYTVILTGYYIGPFFKEVIAKARKRIIILAYHNRRLADYSSLEILTKKANLGCKVTMLSLSPNADDNVLELTRLKLPVAPKDLDFLKDEIKKNVNNILIFLDQKVTSSKLKCIEYKLYDVLPRIHMVLVDDFIYMGFTNYDPSNIIVRHEGKRINPSLVVPLNTPLGIFLLEQIEYISKRSKLAEEVVRSGS